ncbi:NACHT domain-containing protein [Saccharopolyspora shandongensis]|uniref:NACHT domain-containing protein n=1 Tax=Saccharopolyspora shandongensis TaxID=418495 RepID=UPI0034087418
MEESFLRSGLTDLLNRLDTLGSQGVFVLGNPAIGKTVVLQQLEVELQQRGQAVFVVRLRFLSDVDLTASILSEIKEVMPDIVDVDRTIRVSGGLSVRQDAATLNQIAESLQAPVLLLDGLDESRNPQRMAAAVEELSQVLDHWKLVVASRPVPGVELRRFPPGCRCRSSRTGLRERCRDG